MKLGTTQPQGKVLNPIKYLFCLLLALNLVYTSPVATLLLHIPKTVSGHVLSWADHHLPAEPNEVTIK